MRAKSFTLAVHTVFSLKKRSLPDHQAFTAILHKILNITKGMFARLYINDNERLPVPIFVCRFF